MNNTAKIIALTAVGTFALTVTAALLLVAAVWRLRSSESPGTNAPTPALPAVIASDASGPLPKAKANDPGLPPPVGDNCRMVAVRDKLNAARKADLAKAQEALTRTEAMLGDFATAEAEILAWRKRLRDARATVSVDANGEILPEDDERTGPLTAAERATLERVADSQKEEIARVTSPAYMPVVLMDITRLKVGDFGTLTRPGNWRFDTAKIVQVIDDDNLIAEILVTEPSFLFWLSGPTAGLTDGAGVDVSGMFECVGTKRYTTPLGTQRTVFSLKRLVIDK